MRRSLLCSVAVGLAAWAVPALAQLTDNVVKIGVATDLSSLYADINGPGAVNAVQMAIDDFGGSVLGQKIEMVSGDIQNKADVAATMAGRWFDAEKVDVIIDLDLGHRCHEEEDLSGDRSGFVRPHWQALQCLHRHRVHDTYVLANGAGSAVVKAGGDTFNSIKQTAEFGIVKAGQKLAELLVFVSDVHSPGLERAQGLRLAAAFYWDLNDKTRAFAKRYAVRNNGKMPTSVQAGFYSAALQYLNAVKAAGTDDSDKVMAKLKELKWGDPVFGPSYIRADGCKMHSSYLFEVETPAESKGPWDYYKLLATIPGEDAFRPITQSECPLAVRKN